MASPLSIRAVRWTPVGGAAFDCQRADLGILLELVLGWREVADVRGKDTIVPYATGQLARPRRKDKRELELFGWVLGVAGVDDDARMSSYDGLVRTLTATFDPTVRGTLAIDLRDGTTWSIVALPLTLAWGREEIPGVSELSVAFMSVVPEWTLVP